MPLLWRRHGSFQCSDIFHGIRCGAVFLIGQRKSVAIPRSQAQRQRFGVVLQ